jgi:hypothetical protein
MQIVCALCGSLSAGIQRYAVKYAYKMLGWAPYTGGSITPECGACL